MKAWEIAANIFENAQPRLLTEEEELWEENLSVSDFYDSQVSLLWSSNVPGSGAPESSMVAAVQAMENRGYQATPETEQLLKDGLEAVKRHDMISLHQITARLRCELRRMPKDVNSSYWTHRYYQSFGEYASAVAFPQAVPVDIDSDAFREKIHASWLSQLIGAALGTMVEGYTSEKLYSTYGEVDGFLRTPDTYNDDITYELAFLKAFGECGYDVTSREIALAWIGLIPAGWSAEEIALGNIRSGLFPPASGVKVNPFNEWIGAQMRAGVCGMAAPGDAYQAARLAWADGEVSHANNGILGEVFNAVLTSLAFTEQDIRCLIRTAASLIPEDSEYYHVISFALECCGRYEDWHDALAACQERFHRYNWIHAYPNACCEVIALWYGNGDYEKTLRIIVMCGYDVDCNAAMILPVLAIQQGMGIIPKKLIHPNFSTITTYMRDFRELRLEELVDDTLLSIKKACERRNAK